MSEVSIASFDADIVRPAPEGLAASEVSMELECQICFESFAPNHMFQLSDCTHRYCSQCLMSHIDSKLSERMIPVTCPDPKCSVRVSIDNILQLMPPQRKRLYCDILFDNLLLQNELYMHCPGSKCGIPIERPSEGCPVSCPKCRVEICLLCKNESHLGVSCEDYQLRKNGELTAAVSYGKYRTRGTKDLRMCPKCGVDCVKISGCDAVRCSVCKNSFSWLSARKPFTHKSARKKRKAERQRQRKRRRRAANRQNKMFVSNSTQTVTKKAPHFGGVFNRLKPTTEANVSSKRKRGHCQIL